VEGLLILRPEGRIFFVNAQAVAEQIRTLIARYHPRVVALDMSRVTDIEYSALTMLQEGEKRTRENGQVMWLAALNPAVLEVVRRSGLADQLGRDRLLFNAREAIHKYRALAEAKRDG
jgi:sulfate permease, SulP family